MKARITIHNAGYRQELAELKAAIADLQVKRKSDLTVWQKIKRYFVGEPAQTAPPLEVKVSDGVGADGNL